MITDPPKKRGWFQLSLSTCIVLMVVAGVLVWTNVRDYETIPAASAEPELYFLGDYNHGKGWPAKYWSRHNPYENNNYDQPPFIWRLKILLLDFLTALTILAASAFVCEYLIRRERKQEEARA